MQQKIDRNIVRSGCYWSNRTPDEHRKMLSDVDEAVLPRLLKENDADYGKRMREYLNPR